MGRWLFRATTYVWLLGFVATSAQSQGVPPPSGGPYVMRKQVIAGGGERAESGPYVLTGTVAEALTDPAPAAGSGFRLTGGFHASTRPRDGAVFADGFED